MNNETGRFGFPLIKSQYTVCSDVYGHILNVPLHAHPDEEFLDAVQDGYNNGKLHDIGHLVVVKATGKLAFLVTVRLEDDTIIQAQKLTELSALHGIEVRSMEVPVGGDGLPAYQLVTAQLDRIEQFEIAYKLTADIISAEEEARAA